MKTRFNTLAHLPLPLVTTTESGLGLTLPSSLALSLVARLFRIFVRLARSLTSKCNLCCSSPIDHAFRSFNHVVPTSYVRERRRTFRANHEEECPRRTVAARTCLAKIHVLETKHFPEKQTGKEATRNSVHRDTCASEPDAPLTIVQSRGRYRLRNVTQRDFK